MANRRHSRIICAIAPYASVNDVSIKFVSGDYHFREIVFFRALISLVISLAILVLDGGYRQLRPCACHAALFAGCWSFLPIPFFFLGSRCRCPRRRPSSSRRSLSPCSHWSFWARPSADSLGRDGHRPSRRRDASPRIAGSGCGDPAITAVCADPTPVRRMGGTERQHAVGLHRGVRRLPDHGRPVRQRAPVGVAARLPSRAPWVMPPRGMSRCC